MSHRDRVQELEALDKMRVLGIHKQAAKIESLNKQVQELEAKIAAPQVTAPYLFNMGDATCRACGEAGDCIGMGMRVNGPALVGVWICDKCIKAAWEMEPYK